MPAVSQELAMMATPVIETAQIAYRACCRRPDLYTEAEVTYWITRLSALSDRLAWLEYALDSEPPAV